MVGFSKEAHLAYKDSRSDKVYHINLEQSPNLFGMWRVVVKFGPRLGTLTHVDLSKGYTSYNIANNLYEERLAEKTRKGYKPINDTRADLIARLSADFTLPYLAPKSLEKMADFILAYVEEHV